MIRVTGLAALLTAIVIVGAGGDNVFAKANQRIAFASSRDYPPDGTEIFVMNADGSGQRRLTRGGQQDADPVWSPDGTRILFVRPVAGGDIFVMNADSTGIRRLTNAPSDEEGPGWSPDGRRIIFWSDRTGKGQLYAVNANGHGVARRLTSNPREDISSNWSWSPDGKQIAFMNTPANNFDIYVMNADGSGVRRMTRNAAEDNAPFWSPDGKQIAFESFRDGAKAEIYVMNADGSNQRRLTRNRLNDIEPAWSSNGLEIVFTRDLNGFEFDSAEIFVMNADGSEQRRLTNNSAEDISPTWSRIKRGLPFGADGTRASGGWLG